MGDKELIKPSVDVVEAIKAWVQQAAGDRQVFLEYMSTEQSDLPACCIQTLSTNPRARVYRDGKTLTSYKFALWYRCCINDRDADHQEALSFFDEIKRLIDSRNLPKLVHHTPWQMTLDTSPAVYSAVELFEDYKADITFIYR